MIISNDEVTFEQHDMNFVQKFGLAKCTEMVLEYTYRNNLPFIYDTAQLSHLLGTSIGKIYYTVRHCKEFYHNVSIPKKGCGERILTVPNKTLKRFQKIILKEILYKFPVSKYAKAYYKGVTLSQNAEPHIGHKYLLKLDISNFFDSITFIQVYSSIFSKKFFPIQIGTMLTTLCCYEDTLPQGAPTSPAISNIIMKHFDEYFGAWCKKNGYTYTRYCDDLTISGNTSLYPAYKRAKSKLENMGFEINESKTHFITNANRQSVTGITVNEKLTVSKEYKHTLRQEIYYALKYGEDSIIHNNLKEYIVDEKVDMNSYFQYLNGKISYVLSIEPENTWFLNARKKLNI